MSAETQSINKRIDWIDYAKVIAIFLMVLCHSGLSGVPKQIIYQFHMPAFFIISGILYKPKGFKKELSSFLTPIAFFSLLNFAFKAVFKVKSDYVSSLSDLQEGAISLFKDSIYPLFFVNDGSHLDLITGLWFLVALLCVRLFLGIPLINKYKNIISTICILISSTQKYLLTNQYVLDSYIYHSLSAFPFIVIGIWLKDKLSVISNMKIPSSILLLAISSILCYYQGSPDMYRHNYGVNYALFYVNAVSTSVLYFKFCSVFNSNSVIRTYSIGTLLILGIHMMAVSLCRIVLLNFDFGKTIFAIIATSVVMIVSYYPIKWCQKLNPILLGK